jgi:hypothetical protein
VAASMGRNQRCCRFKFKLSCTVRAFNGLVTPQSQYRSLYSCRRAALPNSPDSVQATELPSPSALPTLQFELRCDDNRPLHFAKKLLQKFSVEAAATARNHVLRF